MILREAHLSKAAGPGTASYRLTADGPQQNVDSLELRPELFCVVAQRKGIVRCISLANVIDFEPVDATDLLDEPTRPPPARPKAKAP